jgi:predicted TIM-barrel fold metal-dependent hydrolase
MRIIDAHAHVTSAWEELGIVRELDDTIRLMDRYGIEVSFSSNSRRLRGDVRAGNDGLLEAMARYPERICGYAAANPWRGQEALDEVERCLDAGMHGIKLHISHTLLDYDHPRVIPLFELAVERKVPVLIHCFDGGRSVDRVAAQVPEATIIMGHMGGYLWPQGIEVAARHPNLYLEICCSCAERGIVESAVAAVGAERVLFGTDLPLLDPCSSLYKVYDAEISEEEKALILGGNMSRLTGV